MAFLDINTNVTDISTNALSTLGAPSFVIQELTGTKRVITLMGRALPYRGVTWGQTMATKKVTYPGNPVATQQVLGPDLDNTEIHGMWKDRFMPGQVQVDGDPMVIGTAEDLIELLMDVQRAANLLRVQWGAKVRSGLLKHFVPDYDRTGDVRFNMVFEWQSQNDEIAPRAASEPDPFASLVAGANAIDDQLALESLPGLIEDIAEQVLAKIDSVRALTGQLFDAIRTVNEVLALPANILGAISALVDSISAQLSEEISRMVETPANMQSAARSVASVLSFESWRRDTAASYASQRAIALSSEAQTQQKFAPPPTVYVTVPAGTTLYALSTIYYGTPDFAAYIARVNGFGVANRGTQIGTIKPGTVIAIPPRPSSADAGACCGC